MHTAPFIEAAERAQKSRYVVDLLIEPLGVRVRGSRLGEDREGRPTRALRCDRMVAWADFPSLNNPIIRAIEWTERSLEGA